MKIVVTRDTVGRLIGVVIVALAALLLSYFATAWIWWQLNPGQWTDGARAAQLALAVFLLFIRWMGRSVTIAPDKPDEE